VSQQLSSGDNGAAQPVFSVDLLGMPALSLAGSDGSRALVGCQGAHVLSWQGADGRERLYMSPQTGGMKRGGNYPAEAIRGGVPVCFPQFSGRGPMIKHGFVRNVPWNLAQQSATAATLTLHDNDNTRTHWPHAFQADVTVQLEAGRLIVALTVLNSDNVPWAFTGALHTYFRVEDVRRMQLIGLRNVRYQDATDNNVEKVQEEDALQVAAELDRVYLSAPTSLELREPGVPTLRIEQEGFMDTVVWNPGPEKAQALPDMPDDGWLHMLCVEAACAASPVMVQPGQRWSGRQILTLV